MALINCPECGKEISDKAPNCPHCGIIIGQDGVQKVEVVKNESPEKKAKKKKVAIIAVVILLIITVCGGIVFISNKAKQKEVEVTYLSDYKNTFRLLIDSASACEDITGLVYDVWHKSIYNKANNDFNENIQNLYSGSIGTDLHYFFEIPVEDITIFRTNVIKVSSEEGSLRELVNGLKNPPSKYLELYDELLVLYKSYQLLCSQSLSPSGNISSFSSDVNGSKDVIIEQMKVIDLLLVELE